MKLLEWETVFEELLRLEVSMNKRSRSTKARITVDEKSISMISVNGFNSVSLYFKHILNLCRDAKKLFIRIIKDIRPQALSVLNRLKSELSELEILICEDLEVALFRMECTKGVEFLLSSGKLKLKKLRDYISQFCAVQRQGVALLESYIASFESSIDFASSRLNGNEEPSHSINSHTPVLTWRSSKADLIELILSLDQLKVFGENVKRSELWSYFSDHFQIDLSHSEKYLSQMKIRKNGPVRFIDRLRSSVLCWMEGQSLKKVL